MAKTLKIDFVSDVACPWCAVGLSSLEKALENLDGEVQAELRFHPFELNPQMGPEGQDVVEHLAAKYGSTPEQQAANYENLRRRGADVGFDFREGGRGRVWNTFDAHRLLHWAGTQSAAAQLALKKSLLRAYFTEGKGLSKHDVLLEAVRRAGLDEARAGEILAGDTYAADVRQQEEFYTGAGIHAVPSVIVNDRHLIQGGQPPELFERALRQIAEEAA
jgi:predicted DsbA family dithiol-disulfide isomerase